jgi:hypothetical protein
MTIHFSSHALEKTRRRGVNISCIHQALETPDELYKDIEHKTTIAIKKTDGKFVVVAYRKENETVKVITVYYTTKLDKLLKSKTGRGAWKKIK